MPEERLGEASFVFPFVDCEPFILKYPMPGFSFSKGVPHGKVCPGLCTTGWCCCPRPTVQNGRPKTCFQVYDGQCACMCRSATFLACFLRLLLCCFHSFLMHFRNVRMEPATCPRSTVEKPLSYSLQLASCLDCIGVSAARHRSFGVSTRVGAPGRKMALESQRPKHLLSSK